MKTNKLIDEIREMNLSYLLLAQQMVRTDKAEAIFRLGISEDVADIIEGLSVAQVMKIAASQGMLMCRFRFDDEIVWNLLTSHTAEKQKNAAAGMHAAILMASQAAEVA
ncbi:flagellar transcriptional regulator FlhD [Parvibium lacunae]|uniref:Flagellar transcriptional regulator FlhD n=1 Tax=Parvibium lacunae TaxID=1888893 RepID=A0A368L7Z5_9BURK|nr:flagellar transcriptional regulator FlhD [Parvibium lacunae]RCS59359.1 flagellar transcriptional regulator FlhD [Parvibium lacunae]